MMLCGKREGKKDTRHRNRKVGWEMIRKKNGQHKGLFFSFRNEGASCRENAVEDLKVISLSDSSQDIK